MYLVYLVEVLKSKSVFSALIVTAEVEGRNNILGLTRDLGNVWK